MSFLYKKLSRKKFSSIKLPHVRYVWIRKARANGESHILVLFENSSTHFSPSMRIVQVKNVRNSFYLFFFFHFLPLAIRIFHHFNAFHFFLARGKTRKWKIHCQECVYTWHASEWTLFSFSFFLLFFFLPLSRCVFPHFNIFHFFFLPKVKWKSEKSIFF
jgi:hypothetical protein